MSGIIDRKTFVGAGVASAFAADAAPSLAQSEDFGKPHSPIVPENDPSLAYARPQLGTGISAYVAMPKSTGAATPGIVLSPHFWNIDTQMRDVARRYAKLGYIVIVPGLLDRTGVPNGDGITDGTAYGAAIRQVIAADHMTEDLLAGHDWVRAKTPRGKIGIMGFCAGGGFALQALAGNTNYTAASIFYGYVRSDRGNSQPAPPETLAWASEVMTPVLGSYGADDKSIAPPDIEKAYALMQGPHDYKIYPGAAHAFFDDQRSSYNAAASADAYARTVAWFNTYLK